MSNCKEGEGSFIINVAPFTEFNLKPDTRYRVIVLVGGQVVDDSGALCTAMRHDDSEDYTLMRLDAETVTLISRSRIFLTYYPHNEDFDVIIKDFDGKTFKMLPNVEFTRG